jgi:hypothetical protein
MGECDAVIAQFSHAPAVRAAVQQRDELQREFTALNAAKTNFKEIARLGTAHKAAVAAVGKQRLSEKFYLTLAGRHAALMQQVTAMCMKLADAEEFDTVQVLGAKLQKLKALDVSALPLSSTAQSPAPRSAPRTGSDACTVVH